MDITNDRHECSLHGICGGCAFYDCTYAEQLDIKDKKLRELLAAAGCDMKNYEGMKGSPLIFGYRNKMEFSFGDSCKNGPLTLGLHKKKSFYDVVDTDGCLINHEDFNVIKSITRGYFNDLGITYMDKRSHKGYLRHLMVRRGINTKEILIDLVTTTQPLIPVMGHKLINDPVLYDPKAAAEGKTAPSDSVNVYDEKTTLDMWLDLILKAEKEGRIEGTVKAVLHTKNDRPSDAIVNEATKILYGDDCIYEELCGLRFKISPFSFFQTNTKSAKLIYDTAISYISDELDESATVYDLFSGTGTIAQILAPHVKTAIGVEIVAEAVDAARENAAMNGLTNCEFFCGDVFEVLSGLKERPDAIVLDPPRDGVSKKALDLICSYGVPKLVYISCKPQSFVRDLAVLNEKGYAFERAAAVDQFPWSNNVELVSLLSLDT